MPGIWKDSRFMIAPLVGSRRLTDLVDRRRLGFCGQRMANVPMAVIEPGARIRQARRLQPEQVANGAIEAKGGE